MKWKIRRSRLFEGPVCALCLAGAASAYAADPLSVSDPEAWEVQSVRELMQRDIEQSLAEVRQRAQPAGAPVDIAGGRQAPRLVALYGVGRTLMAEVLVGPQAFLYMHGQAHPVGFANDQGVYQLRGMNGSCIQLQKAQTSHSLCLHTMLGTRQP